jgi:hypothetical protein
MMSDMPDKAKVGSVVLRRVPETKAPEHYLWKRLLEREWAGEWGTLAKFTGYRFKIGLDPAFVEELPQYKKGQLHWYEWIICENGGFISLYNDKNHIGKLWTTPQMGEKVLAEVKEAKLYLTSDERLAWVVHFPLDKIVKVCEVAGARRARQGRPMTDEQKEIARERLNRVRPVPSSREVATPGLKPIEGAETLL